MAGGDENSQRDMSKVIDNASQIQREFGSAFWFAHHMPYDKSRARGSSVLPGAVDTEFGIKLRGKVVSLNNTKQKDWMTGIRASLTPEKLGDSLVLTNCTVIPPEEGARSDDGLASDILYFVLENPGCSQRKLREGILGNDHEIRKTARQLCYDGLLTGIPSNGGPWHLQVVPKVGPKSGAE
jgi:hypothetical protein